MHDKENIETQLKIGFENGFSYCIYLLVRINDSNLFAILKPTRRFF